METGETGEMAEEKEWREVENGSQELQERRLTEVTVPNRKRVNLDGSPYDDPQ